LRNADFGFELSEKKKKQHKQSGRAIKINTMESGLGVSEHEHILEVSSDDDDTSTYTSDQFTVISPILGSPRSISGANRLLQGRAMRSVILTVRFQDC